MFALPRTEAKLTNVVIRTERHGTDDVVTVSLLLTVTGSNDLLDLLSSSLRDSLYTTPPDGEELPGIPAALTRLRTHDLGTLSLAVKPVEGGTFHVEHGIGSEIALGLAKADKWRVDAMEGGTIALHFRISSADVDETELGHLAGKMGSTVHCRFTPPEPATEQTIDGTQEAFDKDHPSEDETQATLVDAMQNGTDAKPKRKRERQAA